MNGFLIIAAILVLVLVDNFQWNRLDSDRQNIKAIKACIYANGYEGANWQDSRQLFEQCLADYKDR